jgi:hypothetical protein
MGWEARSRRKIERPWGIAPLTRDRCLAAVDRLGECLSHFDLKPAQGSDLARMMQEVRWLTSFPADPYRSRGAFGANPARTNHAAILYSQVERIGFTLQWAKEIAGAEAKARWVRKRIDRCLTLDSVAQDYLFEMEMSAHMARWHAATLTFEEPDIVLRTADGGKMVFACKRPRTVASAAGALRDARAQVATHAGDAAAFVLLGMDAIFHRPTGKRGPVIAHRAPTPDALKALGERRISEVQSNSASELSRLFAASDKTVAVIFCGMLVGRSDDPPAVLFLWVHRASPNPQQPVAEQFARATMRMIFPPSA